MRALDPALAIDIQQLSQDAMIDLFEIDLTKQGGSRFRFTSGTLGSRVVSFQDEDYFPIDFESSGWEVSTNGTLPRPKLKFANIRGFLSSVIREFDDMLGAKITRKRTYEKYLDNVDETELKRITMDQGDGHGWKSLGEHDFTDGGTVRFTVLEGNGFVADSIKVVAVGGSEGRIYRVSDSALHLNGLWGQVDSPLSWDDLESWVDEATWDESILTAYFSKQADANGLIQIEETGRYEVFFKSPVDAVENSFGVVTVGDVVKNSLGSAHFPEELYIVQQKTAQNRLFLEFELSSYLDYQGETAPRRRIFKDYCTHTYRVYDLATTSFIYEGVTCPWATEGNSESYYNKKNESIEIADPELDQCSKKPSGCKVRYKTGQLPYAGFPGISAIPI